MRERACERVKSVPVRELSARVNSACPPPHLPHPSTHTHAHPPHMVLGASGPHAPSLWSVEDTTSPSATSPHPHGCPEEGQMRVGLAWPLAPLVAGGGALPPLALLAAMASSL